MPSTEDLRRPDELERAEEIYFRELDRSDEALDVDALCRSHPELAAALRKVHGDYDWLDRLCELESAPLELEDGPIEPLDLELLVEARDEDRYEVQDEIGRGGMGTVYRVWDARLRRELAMKVSTAQRRPSSGNTPASRSLYRFLEEAQVMSQLDHPGVLPVHDLGVDSEGRLFFTMHLVRGSSLKTGFARVGAGDDGWSLARAVGVLVKICETVAFAHAKGVIHRDLKPSNVMIGRLGEVYVMDWGLARVLGSSDPHGESMHALANDPEAIVGLRRSKAEESGEANLLTVEGSVVGTPSFMSPEQAAGEQDRIGTPTDVYAVGAMLYQLLTGTVPYTEPSASEDALTVLERARAGPPPPVEELAPQAPAELVAICERAMEREPDARYAGMVELADDLRAWTEHRVVAAYRTGPWTEARKWARRNRLTALASGLALLSVLVGSLVIASLQTSKSERVAFERSRADVQAYAANIAAAQASIEAGRVDVAREHLNLCPPERRGWEWNHLHSRLDESVLTIQLGGTGSHDVVTTEDGTELVVAAASGELEVFDALDGTRRWQRASTLSGTLSVQLSLQPGGPLACVAIDRAGWGIWDLEQRREVFVQPQPKAWSFATAFHPDGSRLAICSRYGLEVRDATNFENRLFATEGETPLYGLVFTPDGERLLTRSVEHLLVFDAEDGTLLERHELPERDVLTGRPVALSPNGLLAVGRMNGTTGLIDSIGGAESPRVLSGHRSPVWRLAFDPRGELLATSSWDHTAAIWSVRTGERLTRTLGHTARIDGLSWHPTLPRLATTSEDGTLRLWSAFEPPGVDQQRGRSTFDEALALQDGNVLLAGPHPGWSLWDMDSGDVLLRTSMERETVRAIAFDERSGILAAGDAFGSVRIWSLAGELLQTLTLGEGVNAVVFHPTEPILAAGGTLGTLRTWSTASWEEEASLACDGTVFDVLVHEKRRELLVNTRHGPLELRDPRGLELLRAIDLGVGLRDVALSPSGARLATAGEDGVARLWSTNSWELEQTFRGHTDAIECLAFTGDGERLATGGQDQTVRIWSLEDGHHVLTLPDHPSPVNDLVFHPDGRWLLALSRTLTIRDGAPTRRELGARGRAEERVLERVAATYRRLHGKERVVEDLLAAQDLSPLEKRAAVHRARLREGNLHALLLEIWEDVFRTDLDEDRREEVRSRAEYLHENATGPHVLGHIAAGLARMHAGEPPASIREPILTYLERVDEPYAGAHGILAIAHAREGDAVRARSELDAMVERLGERFVSEELRSLLARARAEVLGE